MTIDVSVPDGYVLVKKGGRPASLLRDMAVYLAHPAKKVEFGKGWLADEWIVQTFKLTDASHIRKCRQKARKAATNSFWAYSQGGMRMLFPLTTSPTGKVVLAGSKGWIWAEGMLEAVEAIAKQELRMNDVLRLGTFQAQSKTDNW
jgi:hypothetical protein